MAEVVPARFVLALVVVSLACEPAPPACEAPPPARSPTRLAADDALPVASGPDHVRPPPHEVGRLDDRQIDFQFEGGQLELELYRDGVQIEQVVRNRYAVPVVVHWTMD